MERTEQSRELRILANAEAEQSVIGAMVLFGLEAVGQAKESLNASDFYWPANAMLFDTMVTMAHDGKAVDLITLRHTLESEGKLSEVGGLPYITSLGDVAFTRENLEHYARIIQEKAVLRRLRDAGRAISASCVGDVDDVNEIVTAAERLVAEASGVESAAQWIPTGDALQRSFNRIDDRFHRGGGLRGRSTGLSDIDRAIGGLVSKELIILAARPAMGKTACVSSIALNVAKSGGVVAFFSMEMGEASLYDRLLSAEARVDLQKIGSGKLSEDDWDRLTGAMRRLYEIPLRVDDRSDYSATDIERRARRLRSDVGGLDLIIVDYLQYISGERGKRYGTRNDEVTDIVKGLKQMAKRLDVPVLALAQLSRSVEHRQDKRPLLADLRESGGVEQEADIVAFLYRESYYAGRTEVEEDEAHDELPDEVEFIVAKHRNGPTGFVRLVFQPEYTRFDTLAKDQTF